MAVAVAKAEKLIGREITFPQQDGRCLTFMSYFILCRLYFRITLDNLRIDLALFMSTEFKISSFFISFQVRMIYF